MGQRSGTRPSVALGAERLSPRSAEIGGNSRAMLYRASAMIVSTGMIQCEEDEDESKKYWRGLSDRICSGFIA